MGGRCALKKLPDELERRGARAQESLRKLEKGGERGRKSVGRRVESVLRFGNFLFVVGKALFNGGESFGKFWKPQSVLENGEVRA